MVSVLLISSMVLGLTSLSGCGRSDGNNSAKKEKKKEIITLDVFCEFGNFHGVQEGWMADILKEKFNVKLNITPFFSDEYEKRLKEKDLGDILLFQESSTIYSEILKKGLLYDWNHDDLLEKHGPYIKDHMGHARKKIQ